MKDIIALRAWPSYTGVVLLCCCLLAGCKKFVQLPAPETQVEGVKVFSNEQAAVAAVVGLYSQLMQSNLTLANGAATLYPALSADELINTAPNADYDGYRTNQINATGAGLPRLWTFGYRYIYHANAVLEGLAVSTSLSDSVRQQLQGEMLLVRAFSHLQLVNLFGAIPLVTATAFKENEAVARTGTEEVYATIISDLQNAKALLREGYPSAGRVRPNKWTAAALLSRVYVYREQWAQAEAEATAVLQSGLYSLVPVLNNVFLSNSPEAIWQISSVSPSLNTSEGNTFVPSSATSRPAFAATSYLLNAFETGDLRKTNWLKAVTLSGQPYSYPFKYKVRTGAAPYAEHNLVVRLAELYLLRAEARVQQGNITAALEDLNRVRSRAGLAASLAVTKNEVVAAIWQERRTELMFEWGHRWVDLKRSGSMDAVLSVVKGATWQATDSLYPLPQYELDTNPRLNQNPGY